jgi:hypothetical protein
MYSQAQTVEQYLASLPEERREAIGTVRNVILNNLGEGYEEGITYGMLGYFVPHRLYPAGYHCDPRQPLPFVSLASQKNYMSLYLAGVCTGGEEGGAVAGLNRWFREAWQEAGKRLDMGKSCIRFKKVEELALDVLGEAIRRVPVNACIAAYEAGRRAAGERSALRRDAAPGGKTLRSRHA